MHGMLAMAGLAEAAEFYALVIFSGALFITASLLLLAWWKRWILAAIPAFAICILTGLLAQPWRALSPLVTNDPDEIYWVFRERVFAFFWTVLCLATIACIFNLARPSKSQNAQQTI